MVVGYRSRTRPSKRRPVHPGHLHVRDDDVGRLLGEGLERRLAARGEEHRPHVAVPVHGVTQALEQVRFVIDKQDPLLADRFGPRLWPHR